MTTTIERTAFRGLGLVLAQGGVDDARMIERLSAVGIDEVRRRALALSEGMGGGGPREKYMAQAITAIYSARLAAAA